MTIMNLFWILFVSFWILLIAVTIHYNKKDKK